MAKKQMVYARIELDVWKWSGYVLTGGTPKQLEKWMAKNLQVEIKNSSEATTASGLSYVSPEGDRPWVIWVENLRRVSTLAHEAMHVTARVLRNRGVQLSEETEETYTYTLSHIISKISKVKKWLKAS